MKRLFLLYALLPGTVDLFAQQWYLSPVYHGRDMYSVSVLDRTDNMIFNRQLVVIK